MFLPTENYYYEERAYFHRAYDSVSALCRTSKSFTTKISAPTAANLIPVIFPLTPMASTINSLTIHYPLLVKLIHYIMLKILINFIFFYFFYFLIFSGHQKEKYYCKLFISLSLVSIHKKKINLHLKFQNVSKFQICHYILMTLVEIYT